MIHEDTGSTPRTELPMSITNEQMRLLMKAMEKDPHIEKAAAKGRNVSPDSIEVFEGGQNALGFESAP